MNGKRKRVFVSHHSHTDAGYMDLSDFCEFRNALSCRRADA